MAAGTKLVITCNKTGGGTTTFSYNYAKSNASTANVTALCQFLINNKQYFQADLDSIKEAKTVTTSENVFDLTSEALNNPEFAKIYHNPDAGNNDVVDSDDDNGRENGDEVVKLR